MNLFCIFGSNNIVSGFIRSHLTYMNDKVTLIILQFYWDTNLINLIENILSKLDEFDVNHNEKLIKFL